MSPGCFALPCTCCPGSNRWTRWKHNAPSLRCTASASSGSSSSFQASSAPICPRASRCSPPMVTSRPACWPCWRFCHVRVRPLFWSFVVAFNLVGAVDIIVDYYHAQPGRPSGTGGRIGRHLRDPDHLRAHTDDHARRRILFAGASSTRRGSGPRRRSDRIIETHVASEFRDKLGERGPAARPSARCWLVQSVQRLFRHRDPGDHGGTAFRDSLRSRLSASAGHYSRRHRAGP